MKKEENNIAFIDGQNLYLGTINSKEPWKIDLRRFRVFLEQKYGVKKAYYYIGFSSDEYRNLYTHIQECGFIYVFKKHKEFLASNKKGNVDADIVFDVMEKMYREKNNFNKIILVSGDGDYMRLVNFLIEENKFKKILFPEQRKASSLYKRITKKYFDDLGDSKGRIGKKRKGDLRY